MATRRYIFLVGRPGSGKSDLYRSLGARLSSDTSLPKRIDDFPMLEELARLDDAAEADGRARRFTRTQGGTWLATQMAYDEVLRRIDSDLGRENADSDEFIFVEFARSDIVRSIEENFSKSVRDSAFLIYLYCPLDICLERNRKRRNAAARGQDDHEVPDTQMKRRYYADDHDRLHELRIPYVVVDNHENGTAHLELEVDKIMQALTGGRNSSNPV